MALILTYFSDDRRATPASFDVLVDGRRISTQEVGRSVERRFYDVRIPVPPEPIGKKESVTLRFRARPGSRIATVFWIRLIRAEGSGGG